jgi:signal transduction histidine kinase
MTFGDILHGFNRGMPLDGLDPVWRQLVEANAAILARKFDVLPELIDAFPTELTEVQTVYAGLVSARYLAYDDQDAAIAALERIEPLLDHVHPGARAFWYIRRSVLHRQVREGEQALQLAISAERILADLGWRTDQALMRFEIGMNLSQLGDVAGACDAMVQGMDIAGDDLPPALKAIMQANLAGLLHEAGDRTRSLAMKRELLTKPPFLEPSMDRYRLLLNCCASYTAQGDLPNAIWCREEMEKHIDRERNPVEFYRGKTSRADLSVRMGDLAAAWTFIEEARALLTLPEKYRQAQYWSEAVAEYHAMLGPMLVMRGDTEAGMQEYQRALEVSRASGSQDLQQKSMEEMLAVVTDQSARLRILEDLTALQRERFAAASAAVANTLRIRTRYQEEMARRDAERAREQMRAIIDTQDRVQREIARDLHDSVGQDLSIVRMMLDRIAREHVREHDTAVSMLTQATEHVLKVSGDVRRLSHLIAAADIEGNSLPRALDKLCAAARDAWADVTVSFYSHGDFADVPDDVARAFYRCAQSILQNAMRHANPTRVDVQLLRYENELSLTIEDNGRGFDPSTVVKGLGMREVLARAEAVGGAVEVDSSEGKGTFIRLSV